MGWQGRARQRAQAWPDRGYGSQAYARRIVGSRASRLDQIHRVLGGSGYRAFGWQRRRQLRRCLSRNDDRSLQGRGHHRRGPWRTLEAVEMATLAWVHWFNDRRLFGPSGMFRKQKPRKALCRPSIPPSQHNSNPMASGKPGAVQIRLPLGRASTKRTRFSATYSLNCWMTTPSRSSSPINGGEAVLRAKRETSPTPRSEPSMTNSAPAIANWPDL